MTSLLLVLQFSMSMILDGKKVARQKRALLAERVQTLVAKGIIPKLAFLTAGADEASLSYQHSQARICAKLGIATQSINLAADVTEEEVYNAVIQLNADVDVHGIIVAIPLPKAVDEERILTAIDPQKDVDCLSPINRGRLAFDNSEFLPATPAGIINLLHNYEIELEARHVVIIGRGKAVGWPLAQILIQKTKKGNATVTICHSRSGDLTRYTKQADILVAAVGRARFVGQEFIHSNQIVIDAGINAVETSAGWSMVGDVDFEAVSTKVKAITPVPGGVGPMTVAALLENVVIAAERRSK